MRSDPRIKKDFRKKYFSVLCFFMMTQMNCIVDECENSYSGDQKVLDVSIANARNDGKSPEVFNGNSLSHKIYAIQYKQVTSSNDPDYCYSREKIIYKIKIISKHHFNDDYPANSDITSAFKILNGTQDYPVPIVNNISLSGTNYILLYERPSLDTLQKFYVYSLNYFDEVLFVDSTNAIMITR